MANANETIYFEGSPGKHVYLINQGELVLEKNIKQSHLHADINSLNKKSFCVMKLVKGAFAGMEVILGEDKNYEYTLRTLSTFNVLYKISIDDLHEFKDELKNFMKQLYEKQRLIIKKLLTQKSIIKKSYDKLFKTDISNKIPYRKLAFDEEGKICENIINPYNNILNITHQEKNLKINKHNNFDTSYGKFENFKTIKHDNYSLHKNLAHSLNKIDNKDKRDIQMSSFNNNNKSCSNFSLVNNENLISKENLVLSYNKANNKKVDVKEIKLRMLSEYNNSLDKTNFTSSNTVNKFKNENMLSSREIHKSQVSDFGSIDDDKKKNFVRTKFFESCKTNSPFKIYENTANKLNNKPPITTSTSHKICNNFFSKGSKKKYDSNTIFYDIPKRSSLISGSNIFAYKTIQNDQSPKMILIPTIKMEKGTDTNDENYANKTKENNKIIEGLIPDDIVQEQTNTIGNRIVLKTPVKKCLLDWKNSQENKSKISFYRTSFFNLPLITNLSSCDSEKRLNK